MSSISVVINCTSSGIPDLKKCLKTLSSFATEIVIVDMEAGPQLQKLKQEFDLKIYSHPLIPVVEPARNFGISKAKCNWVLILDTDERLTPELKQELKKIADRDDIDYVRIPRKNIIFGKWLHYTGCWPDYITRFFRRGVVSWSPNIHVQPKIDGKGLTLNDSPQLAIRHYNYRTIDDFIEKTIRYSSKKAQELIKEKYQLRVSDLILKPTQEFNNRFFFQKGYKDGYSGLIFSLLQAFVEVIIYSKIWQQTKTNNHYSRRSLASAISESNYEFGHWFLHFLKKEHSTGLAKNILLTIRQLMNRLLKN